MTIIQPRLENISTFECTVDELLDWGESYVRPRAKLAFEGKGEQAPGDWCRFCRARCVCKACAQEALALVKEEFLDLDAGVLEDESEETDATASFDPDTLAPTFKSPALLTKTDIEQMLPTLNRIESWIEAIFAYSGCYCNVTVNFYPFNINGNRGVAAGLCNVQFVRDGERLSGRASAESEFDVLEDEDVLGGAEMDEELPDYLK